MVLNCGPQRRGFRSLRNRIVTAIAAASATFVRNFPQYQGSQCNHNRGRNLKP